MSEERNCDSNASLGMHSSPSASSLSASTADAGSSHTFNGYSDESGEEKHAKRESEAECHFPYCLADYDAGTGSDADAWLSGMGSASERSRDARSPTKKIRLSVDTDPHGSRAHD